MGLIKDAIKEMYEERGISVQFMNTTPRVIQSSAQAKYADTRKVEKGYIQGVHKSRKEANHGTK